MRCQIIFSFVSLDTSEKKRKKAPYALNLDPEYLYMLTPICQLIPIPRNHPSPQSHFPHPVLLQHLRHTQSLDSLRRRHFEVRKNQRLLDLGANPVDAVKPMPRLGFVRSPGAVGGPVRVSVRWHYQNSELSVGKNGTAIVQHCVPLLGHRYKSSLTIRRTHRIQHQTLSQALQPIRESGSGGKRHS